MYTLTSYITDLGFDAGKAKLGGSQGLRVAGVYAALALGIFLRQISAFPKVDLRLENLRGSVLIASIILALAVTPPLLRWISRRHGGALSWEHITWSITYGFFSDLLLDKIIVEVLKIAP